MKTHQSLCAIAVAALASNLCAEVVTKSYTGSGTVDTVDVEASVTTTVRVFPAGMDMEEARDAESAPFPFEANWEFSWNPDEASAAEFSAKLLLGDYFSVTDAGSMGGVSFQTFSGIVQQIGGKAQWDEASRTLTYEVPLKKRSDSRASTVTQQADPTCDGAKIACNAFLNTTPELEGLTVRLTFDESLDSFTGALSATQYEGAMFTKNQTDMNITIEGQAAPTE